MAYAEHNLPHTVIVTHACTFMLSVWCVSSGTLRQRMAERIIREDSQHCTPTVRFVTARTFECRRQPISGGEAYSLYWCIKSEVLSTACSDYSFKCWCYRYMTQSLLWVVLWVQTHSSQTDVKESLHANLPALMLSVVIWNKESQSARDGDGGWNTILFNLCCRLIISCLLSQKLDCFATNLIYFISDCFNSLSIVL